MINNRNGSGIVLSGIKRIKNANDAIQNALIELLEQKPLSEITVKEICGKADVNRQSFYYYYADITDLAWTLTEQGLKRAVAGCNTYHNWGEGFAHILHFMCRNKEILMNVYQSKFKENFIDDLILFGRELIERAVRQCSEDMGIAIKKEDAAFMVNCYLYIFVGLLMKFMDHGMEEDPDQLVRQCEIMMSDSIHQKLRRFDRSYGHTCIIH